MYKQYLKVPDKSIEKGIRSIEKQILEHQDKIKNPKKYIENWDKLHPGQRKALLAKRWPNDIRRQQEQKRILKGVLEERRKKERSNR